MKKVIKYNFNEIAANYTAEELEKLEWNIEIRGRLVGEGFSMGPGKIKYFEGNGVKSFFENIEKLYNEIFDDWFSEDYESIKELTGEEDIESCRNVCSLDIYSKIRFNDEFFTIDEYIEDAKDFAESDIFEEKM